MQETAWFLEQLFVGKPDNSYILIWSAHKDGKKLSRWFRRYEDATLYCETLKDTNVYFGCGLSPKEFDSNERCSADDICAITNVWIDVDFEGAGHKRPGCLPKTIAECINLVSSPLKPSVIVETGGGIHAYWILKEPLEDNASAKALVLGFQNFIRQKAKQSGWSIDSTHDLARVFRVVGTTNQKYMTPVKVIEYGGPRYLPSDFDDYLISESEKSGKVIELIPVGSLLLNPNAEPPFEKHDLLLKINPDYSLTWNKKRKNLPSSSEYDQSLSNFMAAAGWTDQEITNGLIGWRRIHSLTDSNKWLREDYYRRTIAKARSSKSYADAKERIAEIADQVEVGERTIEEAKPALLKHLAEALNCPSDEKIIKLIKLIGSSESEYWIETTKRKINMGDVVSIINKGGFKKWWAETTKIVLREFTNEEWNKVARLILQACEDVELGEDVSPEEELRSWIESYIGKIGIDKLAGKTSSGDQNPFWHEKKLYIYLSSFKNYLFLNLGENVSRNNIASRLRMAGGDPKQITLADRRFWAWAVPEKIMESIPKLRIVKPPNDEIGSL